MKKKIIDPIYHSIELDFYASLIINTTAFNRLNYIKQMGNTFKHYPSAVHTRFSHCLGVYHLACLLLARNDFKQYLTLHQIDTIKCAGLLHDIAHGPHSHDFEWYLKKLKPNFFFSHENYSRFILVNDPELNVIFKQFNLNPNEIADLINGINPPGFPLFAKDLISSEIDLDRLDYLLRDNYFIFNQNNHDLIKFIDLVQINKKQQLYFKADDIDWIDDFLYLRYKMYSSVYLNKNTERWDWLVIEILMAFQQYLTTSPILKDPYQLYNKFAFMFDSNTIDIDYTTYLTLTDVTFDLFIQGLSQETPQLAKLVHNYNKGIFRKQQQYGISRNIMFYNKHHPIYLKTKYGFKKYEHVSSFYQKFKKNA